MDEQMKNFINITIKCEWVISCQINHCSNRFPILKANKFVVMDMIRFRTSQTVCSINLTFLTRNFIIKIFFNLIEAFRLVILAESFFIKKLVLKSFKKALIAKELRERNLTVSK